MKAFILLVLFSVTAAAHAQPSQTPEPPDPDFNEEEMVRYLNETLPTLRPQQLILVEEQISIAEPVIYADTLRFDDGGVLYLTANTNKSILLVARKIILPPSGATAKIALRPNPRLDGEDGAAPAPAPAKRSRSSGKGAAGKDGDDGKPGQDGSTYHQPHLFIVSESMRLPNGAPPDELMKFIVDADGIDGGRGGDGGDGQNGQHGQDGRHGELDSLRICKKGARGGGRGGDGGDYGAGGLGGNGGAGGTIVFVVDSGLEDVVENIRARTRPGFGGRGGLNGEPGRGAKGGARGEWPGNCRGGSAGFTGNDGEAAQDRRSSDGLDSEKNGFVLLYTVEELPGIFKTANAVEANRLIGESDWSSP